MASNDLTIRLIIRGAAAAPKMQQLQVQLNIENNSGRTQNGRLSFSLKEVISNDVTNGIEEREISIPGSGYQTQFSLGDFFKTPKTGAYLVTAIVNGSRSNELPIKMLL
jgi:hypothetical protein